MYREHCSYLVGVSRAEIDGQKGQPDDARCVHGEAYEFRLVKVLGDFARLDGVDGTDGNQHHVEDLAEEER